HTDGTQNTGANTSCAQQRARAPPPPHSGNGARQSRVKAIPFRPPRNEARLALSSDIGDDRAPATNKKPCQRQKKDTDYWVVDVI
ncbi:hypothetical protein S83_019635, partial [Arachis hypogaea]